MALDPGVALARQGAALDIADPGAAQPLAGALQPPVGDIAGDELAAVLHLGGERQRLPAGAGAEIDDPHAGPGIGEQCRKLRALVLDLDEPLLEGRRPGERRTVLEAEAERRPWRRLGRDMLGGERAARAFAVGLEAVDAQIDRGRGVERRHLVFEPPAINRFEMREEPVRQIARDGARHRRMGQSAAGEPLREALLGGYERRRAKAVAVKACRQIIRRLPVEEQQGGDHPAARLDRDFAFGNPRDPPVERGAVAQDPIDMAGNVRPVLRPDIAPAPEIIGREIVGRPPAGLDRGEDVDRRGDAGPGGHCGSSGRDPLA